MNPKQAYAGILPTVTPIVIPRKTILMLYNPSGTVTATMQSRRGMAPWVVDFSNLGPGSKIPVDGDLWGTAVSTGTGSIDYVYLPRDLVQGVAFDAMTPSIVSIVGAVTKYQPIYDDNGIPLVGFAEGVVFQTITYTVPEGFIAHLKWATVTFLNDENPGDDDCRFYIGNPDQFADSGTITGAAGVYVFPGETPAGWTYPANGAPLPQDIALTSDMVIYLYMTNNNPGPLYDAVGWALVIELEPATVGNPP